MSSRHRHQRPLRRLTAAMWLETVIGARLERAADTQTAYAAASNRGARGSVAAVGAGLFNGGAAVAGVRTLRAYYSVCIVGGLVVVVVGSRHRSGGG